MKVYPEGVNAVIDLEDGTSPKPFPQHIAEFTFKDNLTIIRNNIANLPYPPIVTTELKSGAAEAESTGTVTLDTGAAGSVDGITVDGVEIMSAAVPFNTTLDQTATDVADNINLFQTDYVASVVGAVITLTYSGVDKTVSNGFVIVSSATTITSTDVNMAGGVSAIVGDEAAVLAYLAAFIG